MISSKLPHVGTTIFTVMSQLAHEHQAINLSQGFPGFNCFPMLQDLLFKYVKEGKNQYAPMFGISELRNQLSEKTRMVYGVDFDPDSEVTVVSGATEALFASITALVRTGDEVIILEPGYDSYAPAVVLNGGVPVFVRLNDTDFSPNWDKIQEAVTPKTRAIMVNTPHNPTGYVWTKSDLDNLAELVRDKEIYIISDEVYEHIAFSGNMHRPVFSNDELMEKTFACGSFGKTFHVTGWKVGYCLAPKKLTTEFRKIHQFLTFSTSTPMQYALAEYMDEPSRYIGLNDFYEEKRNLFCEGLKNTEFKFTPTQGSFFQMVSYGHLSDESDFNLAVRLTKEIGVASIPVSAFYHDQTDNKLLRFCFAKEDEELEKALKKLQKKLFLNI